MIRTALLILIAAITGCSNYTENPPSAITHENDKVFIVDRTGERWDVTQAASLGFKPEKFQYGIGRNAFTALDDSSITEGRADLPGKMRVIGMAEGGEARAYSVDLLKRHEVSNSIFRERPVAVGY